MNTLASNYTSFYKAIRHRLRFVITIGLIVITLAAFLYYISHNHKVITKLTQTSPTIIIELLLLYVGWFAAICGIVWISLRICEKTLTIKESILLNGYSTLFNFFVPGQGGIAMRGVYLKKLKNLSVRKFIFVTLIYYMLYAIVSAVLLLADNRPWWQTLSALLMSALLSLGVIFAYKQKSKTATTNLRLTATNLLTLLLITILQSFVQIAIYAVELHSVNSHITLWQAATYTGAANFSLFVALTPGAIGIRESFLIFSRHLSHISVSNIVAASLIDRAVFIIFLGMLFVLTVGFHTKNRLLFRKTDGVLQVTDIIQDKSSAEYQEGAGRIT